jgi:hypothetical protein
MKVQRKHDTTGSTPPEPPAASESSAARLVHLTNILASRRATITGSWRGPIGWRGN